MPNPNAVVVAYQNATEEEDVLSKLMSYDQHTKFIEQKQQQEGVGRAQTVTNNNTDDFSQNNNTTNNTNNSNTLEAKIAKFQQRHQKRQHNRQSRIIQAQDDYIECLKALAETETSLAEVEAECMSIPPTTATTKKYSSAFDDEVVWQEIQFDD